MDMVHFLTYIYFQHQFSYNTFLLLSKILLQFLVSGLLSTIFRLVLLSLLKNWTTFVLVVITKGKNGLNLLLKEIGVLQKIKIGFFVWKYKERNNF